MKSLRLKRMCHSIKTFFKTNKNDILFGAGVVTEVGAVVSACRATLRVKDLSDKCASDLNYFIDEEGDDEDVREVNAKGRRTIYRKLTGGTIKNYIRPAVWLGVSLICYSKAHINQKEALAGALSALAVEQAKNREYLKQLNASTDPSEAPQEATAAPYSAGIATDLNSCILDNGVVIYDSENGYFAEKEGYAQPTKVFLSPTCIEFKKDKYSDWEPNHDWNIHHIQHVMEEIISKEVSLYGFVNLNDIRKHFAASRSYKLEEAENYYILFDPNRHCDDQIDYRIYANCDFKDNALIPECLYIDIFNTKVPKPGELREAKASAVAKNPFKEK